MSQGLVCRSVVRQPNVRDYNLVKREMIVVYGVYYCLLWNPVRNRRKALGSLYKM